MKLVLLDEEVVVGSWSLDRDGYNINRRIARELLIYEIHEVLIQHLQKKGNDDVNRDT